MTYGSMRPLRASERRPEHNAGHAATVCRTVQSPSALGSHGSRCVTIGQPDPAPLRAVAHPHRPQPDHARRRPAAVRRPTANPDDEALERNRFTSVCTSLRSAALGQEGDVDDLTGANLLGPAGNHHQTVCLGQRRQQMR